MEENKELTPEEIEFIKEYRKLVKNVNKGRPVKKTSKTYIAGREVRQRLRMFAALLGLTVSGLTLAYIDAKVNNEKNQKEIYTFASIVANSEHGNPKIKKDGEVIELDGCSIAVVEGKIEDGENLARAFEQSGTQIEVNINSENLKGAIEIPKDDIDDYVLYQVISQDGAELIQTGEEVLNVSYEDLVIGKEQHQEYVDVLYPVEEEIIRGQIDEEDLKIVNEAYIEEYQGNERVKYVVNTLKESEDGLYFRSSPNEDRYSIMMRIPNGTIINGTGQTTEENGREWTQIEYEGIIGWVASEYLDKVILQGKEGEIDKKQEYINNEGIENISGEVTGIDVSGMSGKQLEQLIEKGIPLEVSTKDSGDINTSSVAGNINFVQIKLGATPYGDGEFEIIYNSACEELIKVCEAKKIPYGLYFYTTATNERQAKIEVDFVNQMMKELMQKYDMKYNIVPFTYDFEIAGKDDVHLKADGEDISKAKAYLINKTQEYGISDEVILYTAGRLIKNPNDTVQKYADTLLDLGIVIDELNNPEKFAIWLCAPKDRNGYTTEQTVQYCEMIEHEYGIKVISQQVVLDAYSPTGGLVDINSMKKEYYDKIEKKKNEIEQIQSMPTTEETYTTEESEATTEEYEIGD